MVVDLRLLGQVLLLVHSHLDLPTLEVIRVLLLGALNGLLDHLGILFPAANGDLALHQRVQALEHKALEHTLVIRTSTALLALLATIARAHGLRKLLARLLKQAVEQLLLAGQDAQTLAVGEGGSGDLLAHAGLGVLLLVLGVDALGFLANQLALLDAELLVGFEVDLARLFERFLPNEGGHFAQLGVDLRVGHAVYLRHGGGWVDGDRPVEGLLGVLRGGIGVLWPRRSLEKYVPVCLEGWLGCVTPGSVDGGYGRQPLDDSRQLR